MRSVETWLELSLGVSRPPETELFRSTWRQLGVDSLDLLDLVVRCELEFDVAIPDTSLVRLFTPGDLARYVETVLLEGRVQEI